jgi:hypothetical protein
MTDRRFFGMAHLLRAAKFRESIRRIEEPKRLDDLFHDTLKDIYFAEKKILTALPKMAKAVHSEDLRAAFEKHHGETQGQVERLEKVFDMIGKKPQGKTCDAWPAPGSEDTELGVLMELEVGHGETEVYPRVQA